MPLLTCIDIQRVDVGNNELEKLAGGLENVEMGVKLAGGLVMGVENIPLHSSTCTEYF